MGNLVAPPLSAEKVCLGVICGRWIPAALEEKLKSERVKQLYRLVSGCPGRPTSMIKKRASSNSQSSASSPSGSLRSIPETSSLGGANSAGKGTAGGPKPHPGAGLASGAGVELDVQRISDEARGQLADILGTVEGKKDLVIQPKLISLLEHITPFKFLKMLDVDQIFYLDGFLQTAGQHRFYITRPDVMSMNWIANHIQREEQRDTIKYNIIFVPRKLESCDYILEEEGVYGYVNIFEWDLHLIPLDAHLLSLERFDSFRNLYVENDFTILHSIAKSLLNIERLYGSIPYFFWKGDYAKRVWELYLQLKRSMKIPHSTASGHISDVIILDRRIDLVTPLCRQLTYEGILDDVLHIRSGYVLISKDITGKKQDSKVLMNSKDPVFSVIRSLHFSAVPQTLTAITRGLKSAYSEGKSLSSIPELKSFVQKLPDLVKQHDSLSIHVKVSEHITEKMKRQELSRLLMYERAILEAVEKFHVTDFIEEAIQRQMHYHIPLSLLCLMSTTNNGIRPKYLQSLKKGFLHSYGHKHLVTFRNLYKIGLLHDKDEDPTKGTKSAFKQLTKVLKLVPKDPSLYDVYSPKDMAYVYGGSYKPLSCAVVEYLVKNRTWKGLDDAVKGWCGPVYPTDRNPPSPPQKDQVVLVYYIGGVTFSEVNALQELGRRTNTRYIVATTNTLSPAALIENSLADEM